jgi:hypothetical protein
VVYQYSCHPQLFSCQDPAVLSQGLQCGNEDADVVPTLDTRCRNNVCPVADFQRSTRYGDGSVDEEFLLVSEAR